MCTVHIMIVVRVKDCICTFDLRNGLTANDTETQIKSSKWWLWLLLMEQDRSSSQTYWLYMIKSYLESSLQSYANHTYAVKASTEFCYTCSNNITNPLIGSRDSSVVEQWTHDQKVLGSSPVRSSRIFFSSVSFLCWLKIISSFVHPLHTCYHRSI